MKLTPAKIANQTLTRQIDELEAVMVDNFPIVECPVTHHFTEGLYVREIFLPAGTLVTSKIHKTQHQFIVMKGKCVVWIDGVEQTIEAPYIGVTQPNTRRVVYVIDDSIWATTHVNENNETVEQIEDRIIEGHENPYLSLEIKNRLNNLLNK
jgi:quercetin dioxygenase-like cupin family protein